MMQSKQSIIVHARHHHDSQGNETHTNNKNNALFHKTSLKDKEHMDNNHKEP